MRGQPPSSALGPPQSGGKRPDRDQYGCGGVWHGAAKTGFLGLEANADRNRALLRSLPMLENHRHISNMPGVTKSEVEAFFHSNRSRKKRDVKRIELLLEAFRKRAALDRLDEQASRWLYDNQWG